MDALKFIKEKANVLKEGAGKKTDELIEKAAELRKEYDENQRRKLEDWVYKKEEELKNLEQSLKEREKIIASKELKLKAKFFIRFIGVIAVLSVLGVVVLLYTIVKDMPHGNPPSHFTPASELVDDKGLSSTSTSTSPSTPRERDAYSTFNDIDADNPNFDVGGYCLEKEKHGNITFEECLGIATARIIKGKN